MDQGLSRPEGHRVPLNKGRSGIGNRVDEYGRGVCLTRGFRTHRYVLRQCIIKGFQIVSRAPYVKCFLPKAKGGRIFLVR